MADDSAFDHAVFLGDSRTEGLQMFSGLRHGDFYWARGMSVFQATSEQHRIFTVNDISCNLVETLDFQTYDAVYLMIGINELGYSPQAYQDSLYNLVMEIIARQPQAVVYLQTLPPVNEGEARANNLASYINNHQVELFNQAIVQVAEETQVVLLDTAAAFRDANGQLPAELSSDGAHLTVKGYQIWADFLRCHTMDSARYQAARDIPDEIIEPDVFVEPDITINEEVN